MASAPAAAPSGIVSATSSVTTNPSRASAIAGCSNSASVNLPEPYFSSASANPATVPGTPMPSAESRDLAISGLPSGPRKIVGGGRGRRSLAIVDGDVLAAFRRVNHHKPAAADISRARIGHGHGKPGGDRRIDRIAAAPEHVGADPCRDFLLRHHHAVFGDDGMNGVGGGRRIKSAVLLLRVRRCRACDRKQDGITVLRIPVVINVIENPPRVEAGSRSENRKAVAVAQCYMGFQCPGQNASS